MKKWLLCFTTCLIGLMAWGCETTGHETGENGDQTPTLTQLLEQLAEADNYTLFHETIARDGGTTVFTHKLLDNKTYYQHNDWGMSAMEAYVLEEDGVHVRYSKTSASESWGKYPYTPSASNWLYDGIIAYIDINPDWLDKVSAQQYELKDAYYTEIFEITAEHIASMSITVESHSIIVTVTGKESSTTAQSTYAFLNIGQTTYTLPDFGDFDDHTNNDMDPPDFNPDPDDLPDVEPFAEGELMQGGEDTYTLTIDTPGRYLIWSESAIRLSGTLWDENGHFVGSATGTGPGQNFLLDFELGVGVYTLIVDDWEDVNYGPYIIYVAKLED